MPSTSASLWHRLANIRCSRVGSISSGPRAACAHVPCSDTWSSTSSARGPRGGTKCELLREYRGSSCKIEGMMRRFPDDWENNYQDHQPACLRAFKLPPNSSGKIYICYDTGLLRSHFLLLSTEASDKGQAVCQNGRIIYFAEAFAYKIHSLYYTEGIPVDSELIGLSIRVQTW